MKLLNVYVKSNVSTTEQAKCIYLPIFLKVLFHYSENRFSNQLSDYSMVKINQNLEAMIQYKCTIHSQMCFM